VSVVIYGMRAAKVSQERWAVTFEPLVEAELHQWVRESRIVELRLNEDVRERPDYAPRSGGLVKAGSIAMDLYRVLDVAGWQTSRAPPDTRTRRLEISVSGRPLFGNYESVGVTSDRPDLLIGGYEATATCRLVAGTMEPVIFSETTGVPLKETLTHGYPGDCAVNSAIEAASIAVLVCIFKADPSRVSDPAAQILFTIGDHFEGLHIQRGRSR